MARAVRAFYLSKDLQSILRVVQCLAKCFMCEYTFFYDSWRPVGFSRWRMHTVEIKGMFFCFSMFRLG